MTIVVLFEKVGKKFTETSLIDNITFRLHYKVTFTILIACTILACASTYFGHPIQCMHQRMDLKDLVNNYCWVLATFTIPAQLTGVGINMPHPGLGPTTDPNLIRITEDGDEIRHAFYQFVCMVLFAQAAMFKIPQYIWRSWEDGKIKMMVKELNKQSLDPELTKKKAESRLASERYFVRTQGSHQSYVRGYVFCEMLNFVIVIVQIWFMNWFLGGQFYTYGIRYLEDLGTNHLPFEDRIDPMAKVFPKVTKCNFNNYGTGGGAENKDTLCLLAFNIINEKIYLFLWFWFAFLALWTGIHCIFRILSGVSMKFRWYEFKCVIIYRDRLELNELIENKNSDLEKVIRRCIYGDFFILLQLAKHFDPAIYKEFITDVLAHLEGRIDLLATTTEPLCEAVSLVQTEKLTLIQTDKLPLIQTEKENEMEEWVEAPAKKSKRRVRELAH